MSIVRAIDGTHDWTFGKGINNYKSGLDAIQQNIDTRLNSFLGDCFFDNGAGLDWFNLLGSKNQLALKLAINTVILNTEGVTKIISVILDLDRTSRAMTITYEVETVYSVVASASTLAGITTLILTEDGDVLTTEDGDGLSGG